MNYPADARFVRLATWRPVFWEPVSGTGERITVGVLLSLDEEVRSIRIIRDDVLDALYGKASQGARNLIDQALEMYRAAASAASVEELNVSMMGLHAGPLRKTKAATVGDVVSVAALLYSSMASLDKLDEMEADDAPQPEEVNKRFSTEVRDIVSSERPDLERYFGQSGALVPGGQRVKFGFFSPTAVLHFSVLGAVRQPNAVRDARARLWELHRAREISEVATAALITAVPRSDDPTMGKKQREQLAINKHEIEREADAMNMRWLSVTSASDGAKRVIEVVTL